MTRDDYLAKQRKSIAIAKKQCEPHMDKIRSIVKQVRATVTKQNAELRKIVRAEVARKNAAAIKGPGKVWQVWKINNHTTEYRDVGSFSVSYLSGCNMYYQWCAHNGKRWPRPGRKWHSSARNSPRRWRPVSGRPRSNQKGYSP